MVNKNNTAYAWLAMMLLGVAGFGMLDIFMDLNSHISIFHLAVELGIIGFSLIPAVYLLKQWRSARFRAHNAELQLQEYLQGLGKIIDCDFERWGLSEAERKTAIYILKGFSHKEIAEQCHRTEGTVRQHAVSVYRKSGLGSRAMFSAHFLQQLLQPRPDQTMQAEDAIPESRESDVTATQATSTVKEVAVVS